MLYPFCTQQQKDLVYYRRGLFLCLVILLYNKIMANILPENETVTFEDQTYVNPETSLNEQNTFIDNLRASQARQNAEIQQQTQDLGTAVPSNLGGLVGGEGYFTSRYQTPQTNALVGQLRSTAQAQALSDVLSNQQAMWKQKYNEAYRAAQKRARNRYSGGGGSSTTTTPTDQTSDGEVEKNVVSPQGGFYGVSDAIVTDKGDYWLYTDPRTGEQTRVSKDYMSQIYDENGNITDDGQVILDTMQMLGR